MTSVERVCDGTDNELTYCHDYGGIRGAEVWGPCDRDDCSGSCELQGRCKCLCHAAVKSRTRNGAVDDA